MNAETKMQPRGRVEQFTSSGRGEKSTPATEHTHSAIRYCPGCPASHSVNNPPPCGSALGAVQRSGAALTVPGCILSRTFGLSGKDLDIPFDFLCIALSYNQLKLTVFSFFPRLAVSSSSNPDILQNETPRTAASSPGRSFPESSQLDIQYTHLSGSSRATPAIRDPYRQSATIQQSPLPCRARIPRI